MDATSSGRLCYSTAKDPFTKVIAGWNVSGVESFLSAYPLEKMVIKNGINPKIWVSDGKEGYHNGLVAIYEDPDIYCTPNKPVLYRGDVLRTVYLARKPSPNGLSRWVEAHTYEIRKDGGYLVAYRDLINPVRALTVEDERHFTTTILMTLELFEDYDAQIVCLPKEKIIRFRAFATRFLSATEKDGKVYHFIGTGTIGNPWAESSAKMLKRRYHWFDHNSRSAYSAGHRLNVQMMVYNIFTPLRMGDNTWLSPFHYAGAYYEDYDEAWNVLNS
jgi:hypothetical protein